MYPHNQKFALFIVVLNHVSMMAVANICVAFTLCFVV